MTSPEGAGERYTWVRCDVCGNGLWRAYADRIEMPLTLRGRQKRIISAPIEGMAVLRVQCEKCATWWLGTSQATLHREVAPDLHDPEKREANP